MARTNAPRFGKPAGPNVSTPPTPAKPSATQRTAADVAAKSTTKQPLTAPAPVVKEKVTASLTPTAEGSQMTAAATAQHAKETKEGKKPGANLQGTPAQQNDTKGLASAMADSLNSALSSQGVKDGISVQSVVNTLSSGGVDIGKSGVNVPPGALTAAATTLLQPYAGMADTAGILARIKATDSQLDVELGKQAREVDESIACAWSFLVFGLAEELHWPSRIRRPMVPVRQSADWRLRVVYTLIETLARNQLSVGIAGGRVDEGALQGLSHSRADTFAYMILDSLPPELISAWQRYDINVVARR